jgi:hypothetical protein
MLWDLKIRFGLLKNKTKLSPARASLLGLNLAIIKTQKFTLAPMPFICFCLQPKGSARTPLGPKIFPRCVVAALPN